MDVKNERTGRRGRPKAAITIVSEQVSTDELPQMDITMRQLTLFTSTTTDCIKWLATHQLLPNHLDCTACKIPMSFQQREGCVYGKDGYVWACRLCRKQTSIRVGSFFDKSHLSFIQLLDIIYWWSAGVKDIQGIVSETGVSRGAVIDWVNIIRDVCAQYNIDHPTGNRLGGLNKIVDIDESKFMHKKFHKHKGENREGPWVIGMVERSSDLCVTIPVPDRSPATLLPLMQVHVLPGTNVVTDQWTSYNDKSGVDIKHSLCFVDPKLPKLHTKQIVRSWANAKREFQAMYGADDDLVSLSLQEHMWRKKYRKNQFGNILFWISYYYAC